MTGATPALLYSVAETWIGKKEMAGAADDPDIMRILQLDASWPKHDEVPWCSAMMNLWAFALQLDRSRGLRARSWLAIGEPVPLEHAVRGDVVILKRGGPGQPGPDVLDAQGHVGVLSSVNPKTINLLAGNQGDAVSIAKFHKDRILGLRRIAV